MANQIKIRLKSGEHEIEIEGAPGDVDRLLDTWWGSEDQQSHNGVKNDTHKPRRKTAGKKAASRSPRANPVSESDHGFDVQALVNKMRDHADFATWETHILHKRPRAPKVMLVAWFSDALMTSGEIHKVLQELGDTIDQPGVSNTLKDNSSLFQQDVRRKKGSTPRYKLSGRARKEFEKQLANHG